MKALLRVATASAALMFACVGANATMFSWSYSGINGYSVSGSGTLNATPLGGGGYQVTSISGSRDGFMITGLTAYAGQDNVVYAPGIHLDYLGLAFTDSNGFAYNVFYDTSTSDPYQCGFVGYCEIGPGAPGTSGLGPPADSEGPIVFTLSQVPEPATWSIVLAVGLLAGFGLRQRALVKAARR